MSALRKAEIIPISKGKVGMVDKFKEGHVRSSWQYRRDVYPFLSDAARHVYFMLESHINGFNKESDYVSYSQLQEEKRHKSNPKARKSSSKTVNKGLEELISLGVVSVISSHKKLGNQYKINEISLAEHFTTESTLPSKALHLVKHEHFTTESTNTLPSKDTIDNTYRNNYRESEQKNSVDDVLDLWKPNLHSLNSWLQRSGELPMNQELVNQILIEVNSHYEPRLKSSLVTDTQMYSNFVKWVKRDLKIRERLTPQNTQPVIPQNFTEVQGDW